MVQLGITEGPFGLSAVLIQGRCHFVRAVVHMHLHHDRWILGVYSGRGRMRRVLGNQSAELCLIWMTCKNNSHLVPSRRAANPATITFPFERVPPCARFLRRSARLFLPPDPVYPMREEGMLTRRVFLSVFALDPNLLRCPGDARFQYLDSLCKYSSYSPLDFLRNVFPSSIYWPHVLRASMKQNNRPRLLGICCDVMYLMLVYVVLCPQIQL